MTIHASHRMRFTDSSYGDEICDLCMELDPTSRENPNLALPCTRAKEPGREFVGGYASSKYDWVDPDSERRTPEEYPYSFDSYWIHRGDEYRAGDQTIWCDREDTSKLKEVGFSAFNPNVKSATAYIERFYPGWKLIRLGQSSNPSNGFPIPFMVIRRN